MMFNWLKKKPKEVKFCKDCKYCVLAAYQDEGMDYAKCRSPNFGDKNLVSGQMPNKFCTSSRISDDECGEEAKYFEAKENE